MKKIFLPLLFACLAMPAIADEPNAPEPATLIILYSTDQFVVLRSTGTEVAWTAETGDPRDKEPERSKRLTGSVPASVDLGDVFSRIAAMESEMVEEWVTFELPPAPGQPEPQKVQRLVKRAASSYALIFMDSNGVKTCIGLGPGQQKALRHSLGDVFDDVLHHGPYYRRHLILGLLMSEDAPRQVAAPVKTPQE